jgi:hypothetical protein
MAEPAPEAEPTFRFDLRTSSNAKKSGFEHKGADASSGGIELGEFSRKATVAVARRLMRTSPYYARQLDGPWSDRSGVKITLPSSKHLEAMQEVLGCLGRLDAIELLEETQFEILTIAHKLELSEVVSRAARFIADNLGPDTVVGALSIADQLELPELSRCCYYWIKRSTDPRLGVSRLMAVGAGLKDRVSKLSHGQMAGASSEHASATALEGGLGWSSRQPHSAGAESPAVDSGPPVDVDGLSGKLLGRGGFEATMASILENARQEHEQKRAFFLPLETFHAKTLPKAPPAPTIAEAATEDDFVGEDSLAHHSVRMYRGAPAEDPLGASGAGRDAPAVSRPAELSDDEEELEPLGEPLEEEPASVRRADSGPVVEMGYACPEPVDDGVLQYEEEHRYQDLLRRKEAGRLPKYYRIRKPRSAGYPDMMRCYMLRYRDGWGAGHIDDEETEWKRVVAEVFGDADPPPPAHRRPRPTGKDAVLRGTHGADGVPMCDRGRRHYFELRRERDHSLIMAAVCSDESGGFIFTRKVDDVRPHGKHYLGEVRGDRLGTRFQIFDSGMSVNAGQDAARRIAEIIPPLAARVVAEVHYDTNIMGTVPNSCKVTLHPVPANSQAEDLLPKYLNKARLRSVANQAGLANAGFFAGATRFMASVFEAGAAALFAMDDDGPSAMPQEDNTLSRSVCVGVGRSGADAGDAHSSEMAAHMEDLTGTRPVFKPPREIHLGSRQPDWNEDLEAWTMDFRSRATLASKKNFQLVPTGQREDDDPRVMFLLGKRGKDLYSVDFAPPLSPAAAFGIALTAFAQKWAVA